MPMSEDYAFKIIIVGDSSVGKSCLLRRFQGECFDDGYPATFGVDFVMRRIEIDDKIIKLVIWDTAGQERFKALTRNYYQNADSVIVAFDVTNSSSFHNVPLWIAEAKKHGREDLKVVLVACKCDLSRNRVITRQESQRLAIEYGIMFMETSAKELLNVNETFISLAAQLKNMCDYKDQRLFERTRKHRDATIKIRKQIFDDNETASDTAKLGPTSMNNRRTNSSSNGPCSGASSSSSSSLNRRGNNSKCT